MLVGGPSAQLVECDNLAGHPMAVDIQGMLGQLQASSCPGGCAICL